MELLQTSIALSLIWVVQNVPPPVFEGLKAHLLPLLGHIGVVEVSRPCAIVAKTSCCRRHVNIMKMEKVCLQMKSSWIFRLWQVDSLKMSGEAEWGKQDQEKHLEVESIFRIGDGWCFWIEDGADDNQACANQTNISSIWRYLFDEKKKRHPLSLFSHKAFPIMMNTDRWRIPIMVRIFFSQRSQWEFLWNRHQKRDRAIGWQTR